MFTIIINLKTTHFLAAEIKPKDKTVNPDERRILILIYDQFVL